MKPTIPIISELRKLTMLGILRTLVVFNPQTFIDTYAMVAAVRLYDSKVALVATVKLYDRVIPVYNQYGIPLMRILTELGTKCCGARERHGYQLYLAVEVIDHTKTKAKSPQTNGICERFHRIMQEESYVFGFRKKIKKPLTNFSKMLVFGYNTITMNDHILLDVVSA